VNILFIGDIVGKVGRRLIKTLLSQIVKEYAIDLTIANCENAAGGFGITENVANELFSCGIHIMTSGNHIWDKKEALSLLSKENRILRPINYPPGVPGVGSIIMRVRDKKVAVMNVSGRVFMSLMDCPFRRSEEELQRLKEEADIVIVDFHAEATSEKIAYGYYMDGRVSAVLGTHTHVQTADEQILPKGTGYITDVGMTGPAVSVIGVDVKQIIERFLTSLPKKFDTARGEGIFSAVVLEIDDESGLCSSIERLQMRQ
jgi:hypothetical protein